MNYPLAYFFPAKIVFGSIESIPETIPCNYCTLGKLAGNVYFNTAKGKIVTEGKNDSFSVFALVNGAWVFLRNFSADFDLSPWIERMAETLPEMLSKNSEYVKNPFLYEQAQAAKRKTLKEHNDEQDKIIARQKEERAQKEKERFDNAIKSFFGGESISWEDFENACKNRQIIIPIQCLGWGRKNVTQISKTSYSLYGKGKSSVIFEYINQLANSVE